jgi:hypothetical protein
VTAAHVLWNSSTNLPYADSISLISYSRDTKVDIKDTIKLSLKSSSELRLIYLDIFNDCIVIKLGKSDKGAITYFPSVIRSSSRSTRLNLIPISESIPYKTVEPTTVVYTVGFPKSLSLSSNYDYDRPLFRKGIVAGLDYIKNRIIVDCPTYKGNSGGLVFQELWIQSPNMELVKEWKIIGLVSAFVPQEEKWINESYGYANTNIYNSGYSVIIPIDFVKFGIDSLK